MLVVTWESSPSPSSSSSLSAKKKHLQHNGTFLSTGSDLRVSGVPNSRTKCEIKWNCGICTFRSKSCCGCCYMLLAARHLFEYLDFVYLGPWREHKKNGFEVASIKFNQTGKRTTRDDIWIQLNHARVNLQEPEGSKVSASFFKSCIRFVGFGVFPLNCGVLIQPYCKSSFWIDIKFDLRAKL